MPKNENSPDESKEDFCGACLAVPAAIAGASVAGITSKSSGSHKKTKTIIFWVSMVFTVLSLALAVWWFMSCKTCQV